MLLSEGCLPAPVQGAGAGYYCQRAVRMSESAVGYDAWVLASLQGVAARCLRQCGLWALMEITFVYVYYVTFMQLQTRRALGCRLLLSGVYAGALGWTHPNTGQCNSLPVPLLVLGCFHSPYISPNEQRLF